MKLLICMLGIVLLAGLILFGCTAQAPGANNTNQTNQTNGTPANGTGGIGMANPASVFCKEHGGTLEIRDFTAGQAGFCKFSDGSECEEWKYFRGECAPGTNFCKNECGDGTCAEVVCMALGCPCAETHADCPEDCS